MKHISYVLIFSCLIATSNVNSEPIHSGKKQETTSSFTFLKGNGKENAKSLEKYLPSVYLVEISDLSDKKLTQYLVEKIKWSNEK
jgi:hypothetical protein